MAEGRVRAPMNNPRTIALRSSDQSTRGGTGGSGPVRTASWAFAGRGRAPSPSISHTPPKNFEPIDEEAERKVQKQREMRKLRVKEIIETEKTYLNSLKEIYNNFIVPLRSQAQAAATTGQTPILTLNNIEDIFSNWETLMKGHTRILAEMEKNLLDKEDQLVSPIFNTPANVATYKLYRYFVNNYDKSVGLLKQHLDQGTPFGQFILEKEAKLRGLSLTAFMIQPIQRLPRLVLLIDALLKETPQEHPDFQGLKQAKETIEGITLFINESKKKNEQAEATQSLLARMKGFPQKIAMVPDLKILKHGILFEQIDGFYYRTFVLLLDKFLVFSEICDEKKGEFRFMSLIAIEDLDIIVDTSNPLQPFIHLLPMQYGDHICAVPEDAIWSCRKGYLFTSPTSGVMKAWWSALCFAIKSNFQLSHTPKWKDTADQGSFHERRTIVHTFQRDEVDYSFKLKVITKSNLRNELDGLFTKICSLSDYLTDGHSTLVNKLATPLADSKGNPSELCVGKAFVDALHIFNIYELVNQESPLVQDKLEQLKEKDKKGVVAQFLKNFEAEYEFNIEQFLFARMNQKVNQMKRILLDVLNLTPPHHPDYHDLIQAEGQARNLAMKIQRSAGPYGKRPERNIPKRSPHQFTSKSKELV